MAVRNQRANCPATSPYIVAAMFFMRTMVGDRLDQINMPRLDAYANSTAIIIHVAVTVPWQHTPK